MRHKLFHPIAQLNRPFDKIRWRPRTLTCPPPSLVLLSLFPLLLFGLAVAPASSQVLAPHSPLRILIVSDEVNPHGLADEELTQPGELAATLLATPGLHLDHLETAELDNAEPNPILEIATDDLADATALLSLGPDAPAGYDVLIYFAHRRPNNGVDDQLDQDNFVAAVDQFLVDGGGVISFHHGLYETTGKRGMQSILGAAATGSVVWDTTDGQNVIAVAEHFISSYAISYDATVSYSDPTNGIPSDSYPLFNNTPDERYPVQAFEQDAGEIEVLFASDYDGGAHVLGFTHRRPGWSGIVVVYQPGEHQPTALQPGNNLQILLNAIVYTATYRFGELLFADGFESGGPELWSSASP